MTNYTWELGVNWNAADHGGARGLPNGLVNADVSPAVVATPMALGLTDTITFVIYDITSDPVGLSDLAFEVTAQMADAGVALVIPFATQPVAPTPVPPQFSVFFQRTLPLPAWTTIPLSFANKGEFLLTFNVTARVGSSPQRWLFSDDPEMVVGEAGGPSEEPGGGGALAEGGLKLAPVAR